jgi:hypothetical protein
MNEDKIKILKMLESGKIEAYEALELLNALDEIVYKGLNKSSRKNKKLSIEIKKGEENKQLFFDIGEIIISSIMSKINTELKYYGINLSMDELKEVKEKIYNNKEINIKKDNTDIIVKVS